MKSFLICIFCFFVSFSIDTNPALANVKSEWGIFQVKIVDSRFPYVKFPKSFFIPRNTKGKDFSYFDSAHELRLAAWGRRDTGYNAPSDYMLEKLAFVTGSTWIPIRPDVVFQDMNGQMPLAPCGGGHKDRAILGVDNIVSWAFRPKRLKVEINPYLDLSARNALNFLHSRSVTGLSEIPNRITRIDYDLIPSKKFRVCFREVGRDEGYCKNPDNYFTITPKRDVIAEVSLYSIE